MFVVFIGCVLQFDFTKGNAVNQMSPQLLEISLKHVNTLLADIDDTIAVERELLSQIGDNPSATGVDENNVENFIRSDLLEIPRNKEVKLIDKADKKPTIITYERAPDVALKPSHSNGTLVEMKPRQPPNWPPLITNVMPEFPVFKPDPHFEGPISHPTTAPPTTTTKVNRPPSNAIAGILKNSPFRKSMVDFMNRENLKYICAFIHGLAESLTRKSDNTVNALLQAFGTVLLRKANNNQLNCAGELLVKRFKALATFAKTMSPSSLKAMLGAIVFTAEYHVMAFPDGLELLKSYEKFFNVQEGNHLLDINVAIHNYDVQAHGQQIAETLSERAIEAFTAPSRRLCGTPELQAYNEKANDAYSKRFQNMRSGQGNVIASLIETFMTSGIPIHQFLSANFTNMPSGERNNITSLIETFLTSGKPNRRSLGTHFKNIKSEYKNMIRHYMKKHPSIFRTFAKHYKRSEERNKHSHSKHKKHRNSHHRKHHHSSYKSKHHKEKTSKIINDKNKIKDSKIMTLTMRKQPRFRVLPELNTNTNHVTKVQKRFNIIPSVISRRFVRDKEKRYDAGSNENIERVDIFNNLSETFPTTSISTKRFAHNNANLAKIIGESSYSDEEVYFKTMLKDAYFHGNYTLPGDRPE